MGLSLKDLNSLRANLPVELYPGYVLNIVYRVDAQDDALTARWDAAREGNLTAKLREYREIAAALIVSWDLDDGKGKTLPVNAETLKLLNFELLDKILTAIVENRDPNLIRSGSTAPLEVVR